MMMMMVQISVDSHDAPWWISCRHARQGTQQILHFKFESLVGWEDTVATLGSIHNQRNFLSMRRVETRCGLCQV